MPLFEYWCQGCGYEEERLVKTPQEVVVSCRKCGAKMDRKVGKVAHYEFKGVLA